MAPDAAAPRRFEAEPGSAPRILVVEDEFLVAVLLKEDLLAAGYTVVGPFNDLGSAMYAAGREAFDVAVLDVNLKGQMVYPLADALTARAIPYIFLSGYGRQSLPEQYRLVPRIAKPYDRAVLISEIHRIVPRAGG